MKLKNPYKVPPFGPGSNQKPSVKFYWWSWHPCYPYWSKSCWGGVTEAEAWDALRRPMTGSLSLYHNKLIREGDGQFTEVADLPCQRLGAWREIALDKNKWRRPTDAKPIEGWNKA
jgi:hypothetical protein